MTITVATFGPFYISGEISFSSLRTNFRATDIDGTVSADTSPISASQLRRITSQSNTNPTVPNATENSQISTGSYLEISQFRNSIKYYKVSQTDTDTNLNISTQAWNSNLSKNIKKKFSISGTIGSSNINTPALSSSSVAHCNLEIVVTGKILGAGGAGGTANGGNGGNGGNAMNIQNTLAQSPIKITIFSSANIYGGGGGGGAGTKGGTGGKGADGTIAGGSSSQYQELFAGSRCSNQTYFGVKGEAYYFSTYCSQQGYSGYYYNYKYPNDCGPGHTDFNGTCTRTVTTQNPDTPSTGGNGGEGGNGGDGGVGQGYGQNNTPGITGPPGAEGSPGGGGTAAKGADGGKGGDGGDGGTYGNKGGDGKPGVGKSGELASGTTTPTVTYGLTGFNRYYSDSLGVHFYTSNPGEEFISENQYYVEPGGYNYFYVALEAGKIPGTVALHRFFTQSGTGDHLFSLNRYEVSAGWNYEGVVGYVWPPNAQGANSNPIYRKFNGLDHFLTTNRNEAPTYALEGDPLFYAVTNQQYTDYVIVNGTATTGGSGTAAGTNVGKGGIAGKAITGTGYILNPSPPPEGTVLG